MIETSICNTNGVSFRRGINLAEYVLHEKVLNYVGIRSLLMNVYDTALEKFGSYNFGICLHFHTCYFYRVTFDIPCYANQNVKIEFRFLDCAFNRCDLRPLDTSLAKIEFIADSNCVFEECDGGPIYHYLSCPSKGAFVGWKKAYCNNHNALVELYVPSEAKRTSGNSCKCRVDKAKVVSILDLETGFNESVATSAFCEVFGAKPLEYKVGSWVEDYRFDSADDAICAGGIHLFIDKQAAIDFTNTAILKHMSSKWVEMKR